MGAVPGSPELGPCGGCRCSDRVLHKAAADFNAEVEVAGVFEPSPEKRSRVEGSGPYRGMRWFESESEMLADGGIVAVASEGNNNESLTQTEAIVAAGKHVWYDKPAGDVWEQWQRVIAAAQEKSLLVQMGYMFRYHDAFQHIQRWARSGLLGDIFSVRAHMSTWIPEASQQVINVHSGGIFYDLAGHMLDQIVRLLGRPSKITSFLRSDSGVVPGFADNTLSVFEYEGAMAFVDIAAMEARPMARRFEVYGLKGSAIITEPFEPGTHIRLCLDGARDGYSEGEQTIAVQSRSRQELYALELEAFLDTIAGDKPPDRPPQHELLVQETLLRATGALSVS